MKLNMIQVALRFELFLDRGTCVVLHHANAILGKGKPRHFADALRYAQSNIKAPCALVRATSVLR